MKISTFKIITHPKRAYIEINGVQGEIAPLSNWSSETLNQALIQLQEKKASILELDWTLDSYQENLQTLNLYPSVDFGLESAILSLLDPVNSNVESSALLMGTQSEIFKQAIDRYNEGYRIAKLKVSNLTEDKAFNVISLLKNHFLLRIDVNRSWPTEKSLNFFSAFSKDAFDYVEEPFQNPLDLYKFKHPLAVDESFPKQLTLSDLEKIPFLKALVFKPTIQGGMNRLMPIYHWTKSRGIDLVLSSSYESEIGLKHICGIASRLALKSPVGIGTKHFVCK